MVKVLCKGGPYYWIKKPFNALERQVWLWDLAQSAKKGRAYHQERADAGGPKAHVHRELLELFEPRWQETVLPHRHGDRRGLSAIASAGNIAKSIFCWIARSTRAMRRIRPTHSSTL